MAVIASDILIKTMLEAALADMRKNSWMLDDVFGGLATDGLALHEYGYKEVQKAKEWFMENQVDVYLNNRIDNPRFPCITVVLTSSREMTERASLGDEGSIEEIEPKQRRRQIQRMYPPFTPKAYDPSKGQVTFPDGTTTDRLVPGQFLVSARSGKAYVILENLDTSTFTIKKGVTDDFTGAYIVPPTSLWNLHREQTFMEETFAVGLHAQSDTNQCIWLRQLVTYILLRYKEAYLEARGYELSTFQVGAVEHNPHFEAEMIYSCPITMTGHVENSWIKFIAPKLQAVSGKIAIIDGPKTPDDFWEFVKNQGWEMQGDEGRED